MAITRTPIIDDDGTGKTGTAIDNAWKQQLYDQIDGASSTGGVGWGTWQTVPFNAANFQWPGVTAAMVVVNQYTVINQIMFWLMNLNAAPGNAGSYLYITVPGGRSVQAVLSPVSYAYDGGAVAGSIAVGNAATIAIQKNTGATWTGPVFVQFTAILALA